jgi:hypothetical protein
MNNYEKSANDPFNVRVNEICGSEFGIFRLLDQFVQNIRLGREPSFIEDIELEPMLGPNGINDVLSFEARRDAMKINRKVMESIYGRYHVDPVKALARFRFRSSVADIKSAKFMGVEGIGYKDTGNLSLTVQKFGRYGIAFVERYDYSMRENPRLEVDSSRAELLVTNASGDSYATPYRYEFSAHKSMGGNMPYENAY